MQSGFGEERMRQFLCSVYHPNTDRIYYKQEARPFPVRVREFATFPRSTIFVLTVLDEMLLERFFYRSSSDSIPNSIGLSLSKKKISSLLKFSNTVGFLCEEANFTPILLCAAIHPDTPTSAPPSSFTDHRRSFQPSPGNVCQDNLNLSTQLTVFPLRSITTTHHDKILADRTPVLPAIMSRQQPEARRPDPDELDGKLAALTLQLENILISFASATPEERVIADAYTDEFLSQISLTEDMKLACLLEPVNGNANLIAEITRREGQAADARRLQLGIRTSALGNGKSLGIPLWKAILMDL